MDKIKEAANKYAEERYSRKEHPTADAYSGARNGFIAGVEFAQQWISVDDEFPPINENVFIKFDFFGGIELNLDEHERISYTVGHRFTAGGEIRWAHSSHGFLRSIKPTHWRPIELK